MPKEGIKFETIRVMVTKKCTTIEGGTSGMPIRVPSGRNSSSIRCINLRVIGRRQVRSEIKIIFVCVDGCCLIVII